MNMFRNWNCFLSSVATDGNDENGLQSNDVKCTPQEAINEFIIQKLNPLLVADFRLISAFLYV